MKKFTKYIILIISVILFSTLLFIIIDGITDDNVGKSLEYAVVYGSKVNANGEPSNRLKARLNKSIELIKNGKIKNVIVSGGTGETNFNEAIVMKKYLLKNGIDKNNIIVDNKGNTTKLTSLNTYKIINKQLKESQNEILGISQFFHCSRVKLSLKQAGFNKTYCLSPKYFELRDIYSTLREIPANIKYLINY